VVTLKVECGAGSIHEDLRRAGAAVQAGVARRGHVDDDRFRDAVVAWRKEDFVDVFVDGVLDGGGIVRHAIAHGPKITYAPHGYSFPVAGYRLNPQYTAAT
jgi:hypothetical protein